MPGHVCKTGNRTSGIIIIFSVDIFPREFGCGYGAIIIIIIIIIITWDTLNTRTHSRTHSLTDRQTRMQYTSGTVFQRWQRHKDRCPN